eukprot:CCRYP_005472-RA/>CCRYP_005472-RA protein AED:0.35 eAED:0.35 QI:0/0/0/1/0/0/2/0/122
MYAPVVQWTTIRLMLILEVLLGLKSKQGNITAVFVDADVEKGKNIYTETALSTMEAKIIALVHCCQELFPIMDLVSLLGTEVGLRVSGATMNGSIHEDNAGALVLAETLPPQFTPRSKHYAI